MFQLSFSLIILDWPFCENNAIVLGDIFLLSLIVNFVVTKATNLKLSMEGFKDDFCHHGTN